jgi:hypothetical protein
MNSIHEVIVILTFFSCPCFVGFGESRHTDWDWLLIRFAKSWTLKSTHMSRSDGVLDMHLWV